MKTVLAEIQALERKIGGKLTGNKNYKVPVGDNTKVFVMVNGKDRASAQDAAVEVVEGFSRWGKDLTVGVPVTSTGGYKVPILDDGKPSYNLLVSASGRADAQDVAAEFIEELRRWGSNLTVGIPLLLR